VNPNWRFTAVQALCHDWIDENSFPEEEAEHINPIILDRLNNFKYPAMIAKEAMKVMVE